MTKNKYRVLINPSNSCAWSGYIYADSLIEAKRIAIEKANDLGGDYLDVDQVIEVNND